MHLLENLATIFFNVFGITQPTPTTRRGAAWFLLAMLFAVAAGLATGGVVLYRLMHV